MFRAIAFICAALFLAPISGASATNQRTFVASYGFDTGNCNRSSPCGTLLYALTQTHNFGEITIIDTAEYAPSGGLNTLRIDKSVTIAAAEGADGEIGVISTWAGITINASGAVVQLRGLSFRGTNNQDTGIFIVSAAAVMIERCHFKNLDKGIDINSQSGQTTSSGTLSIADSTFVDVGTSVALRAFGTSVLNRLSITGASGFSTGISVANSFANTSVRQVHIRNSTISNRGIGIFLGTQAGDGLLTVSVANTKLLNDDTAIRANGPQSVAILDRVSITGSASRALSALGGATLFSYGNNAINDNASLGDSPAVIPLH